MNNKLVVVPGSLLQVAMDSGRGLAESFLNCEIVVLIDQSGSMSDDDARDGQTRFDVADNELAKIQSAYPGQVAVVAFSDRVEFCPNGVPIRFSNGTDMAAALQYIRMADGVCKIVLVSDGEPNDEEETLREAARFRYPVDTIFIGQEGSYGQSFLDRLAHATGGQRFVAPRPGELGMGVVALLESR